MASLSGSVDLPGVLLVGYVRRVDIVCLYVDRYQRKYHGNLRFRSLFSEGFRLQVGSIYRFLSTLVLTFLHYFLLNSFEYAIYRVNFLLIILFRATIEAQQA
jgi:hypothetical protein